MRPVYEASAAGYATAAAMQGRILVLETKPGQHKLHLVCEKETRGAVYTMSGFQVAVTRTNSPHMSPLMSSTMQHHVQYQRAI